MVRKEFVITEKQLAMIRKESKNTGISQNEVLRRLIDKAVNCEEVQHGNISNS